MVRRINVYQTDTINPYQNLAIEEYLTFHTEADECILFLWQNQHTVVIGKNQNAWKECKVHQLESDGGYLARRLSGGGAVFHDLGNLNFTFCTREEHYDVKKQTEVILQAVKSLGIQAEKTGRNDITVNGRKFSGHAFYKSKGFCYHHGTILIGVDQNRMTEYLNVSAAKLQSKGVDSVRARTINLKEICPDLTILRMKEALVEAFGTVYGLEPAELAPSRLNWEEISHYQQRLGSWEWLYGRKIPFDHKMEQRFSWGEIEMQLHVMGGVIVDVQVYSDAMEENLPQILQDSLKGCAYQRTTLLERIDSLQLDSGEDIKKLIEQQL